MFIHLYLSGSALERILTIRLLAEFRPIDEPILHQNQSCYMDGIEIESIKFESSDAVRPFRVGEADQFQVRPIGRQIDVHPVRATVVAKVLLSPIGSVRAAGSILPEPGPFGPLYGLPDRPEGLKIHIPSITLDLFFDVSPAGAPTLRVELQNIFGAELLGDAQAFLNRFRTLTLPLAVNAAFEDFLSPGHTRVLSAGMRTVENGIAMRFEYGPVATGAYTENARLVDWNTFFHDPFPSPLGGEVHWALDLPVDEFTARTARALDGELSGPKVKPFKSSGPAEGKFYLDFFTGLPAFSFTKSGYLESACAGLDIRAEIELRLWLSVSAPNTLRIDGSADVDLNDWDSFKCILVSLLNPFAGLITTVDMEAPWWSFIFISIMLPAVPIVFGLGGDDYVVGMAIDEARKNVKKNSPRVVKTSATTFYAEMERRVTTELTRDWIVLNQVHGAGNRLVLSGAFNAPEIRTLPRLRGTLTDEFGFWKKKDRCSTNPKYFSSATISLALEDAVTGTHVHPPLVPVRYGINMERVGDRMVEVGETNKYVIDDPGGIYGGAATRIHWIGGVPGTFEIQVDNPPEPFASAPYPLRLRFFTSVGVREFEIAAPPPVPKPPTGREAAIAEDAKRISECYVFSSLLTMVKALQVKWLPMPQPRFGQHWQVLVQGLSAEDRLVAWNVDTREVLAEVRAYEGGLAELSLVMAGRRPLRALQLTLNDAPFLEEVAYRHLSASIPGRQEVGPTPVMIRQTPLHPVAEVELEEPASALTAYLGADSLRMLVQTERGTSQIDLELHAPHRVRKTRLEATESFQPQLPSRSCRIERSTVDGREIAEIVGPGLREEVVLARYYARPWYDRGSIAGRLFAQLDETGTRIRVYHYGSTVEASPEVGEGR